MAYFPEADIRAVKVISIFVVIMFLIILAHPPQIRLMLHICSIILLVLAPVGGLFVLVGELALGAATGHRVKSLQAVLGFAAAISMAFPAYAQNISNPVCKSASLWELPGPRAEIQIGERKLSIPTALDGYLIGNGVVGFLFHIKPDGNLEPDDDPGDDQGWDHQLVFHIQDNDSVGGAADTKDMLEIMGFPGIPEKHPDVKGFDAYKGRSFDIYVAKTTAYYLAFACSNNIQGWYGPQSNYCTGHRRPWPGSSLEFAFGRQFIAVSPVINACISKMLEDFSALGTGKVTQ
jgi:hypothetical protein